MQTSITYRNYSLTESIVTIVLNMNIDDSIEHVYNVLNADCLVSVKSINNN